MGFLNFMGKVGSWFSRGASWLGNNVLQPAMKFIRPAARIAGSFFGVDTDKILDSGKELLSGFVNRGIDRASNYARDRFAQTMGKFGFDHKAHQQVTQLQPITSVDNPAKSYYQQQSQAMKYVKGESQVPRQEMQFKPSAFRGVASNPDNIIPPVE